MLPTDMKPSTTVAAAVWAIFVFGLFATWHFVRERTAASTEIGGLRSDLAVLADRSANLDARLAKLQSRMQVKSKTAGEAGSRPAKRGPGRELLDQLHTDPKVQLRYFAYERSGLAMKYSPLFQRLGLSPAQITKCEDNLIRHEEDQADLMNTLRDEGLTLSDPAAGTLFDQEMAGYKSAQQALLGQDGLAQLTSYEAQMAARQAVNGYAGAATMEGIPLSGAQLQQLAALAVQEPALSGAAAPVASYTNPWARIGSQAQSFLTPDQLSLMETQEFWGPFGSGGRYAFRLNVLVNLADQADAKTENTSVGAKTAGN